MAPNDIVVTAPTPTVNPKAYRHSGRGGAGNMYRPSAAAAAASSSSSLPASSTTPSFVPAPASSTSRARRFHSGVGGAGNVHASHERAPLNFEEEINRARARERSGVGHVGIGGAGNVFRKRKEEKETGPRHDEKTSIAQEVVGDKAGDEKARRGSLWSLGSFESVLMKPVKASS